MAQKHNSKLTSISNGILETKPPLYPRQKMVLDYIERYIAHHGRTPTLTEIKNYMRVKTLSTVHWHLIQLEKKGYIKRDRESKGIDLILTGGQFSGAVINVPLVGYITAGKPIDAIEQEHETIPIPEQLVGRKAPKELFCLTVRGDSMIDAYVLDGDTIICEKTNGYANNGDMVVALLPDGTATLKKFYLKKKYVLLQPANPEFPPIKAKNVLIQGKAIAILRKL